MSNRNPHTAQGLDNALEHLLCFPAVTGRPARHSIEWASNDELLELADGSGDPLVAELAARLREYVG